MSKLITFSIGGVHPADNKLSRDCRIETLPLPPTVYVSVAQSLGAPAKPVVAAGDKVGRFHFHDKPEQFPLRFQGDAAVADGAFRYGDVQGAVGAGQDVAADFDGDETAGSGGVFHGLRKCRGRDIPGKGLQEWLQEEMREKECRRGRGCRPG